MTDFQEATERSTRIRVRIQIGLVVAGLVLGTAAIYQQALGFEFVNADDHTYVSKNIRVQRGLTAANVAWAFTSMSVANWHPLTWLSHMLDVEIHGLDPGGHHLTNVVLHIANCLLLFALLRSLTGALWRSAVVAALFAVHPLHVESVAWVSERKDLLCAFFWFLAMWSYSAEVKRAAGGRPVLALTWLFSLAALLSKPMAVTLPCVLLLLDYWPLERLDRRSLRSRIEEKLPIFALTVGSVWMTLVAQRGGGAMESASSVGIGARLANAAVSYATYLLKCVWPSDLALLRPHPYIPGTGGQPWEVWQIAGAIVLLVSVSGLVALARRGYLTIGWLWFLGTLVPVIGIVQVGLQAYADRYTYVPLVGIFVMGVWGVAEAAARLRARTAALDALCGAGIIAVIVALGAVCWQQASHWRASIPLFEHALRVTPDNTVVHLALASSLLLADRGVEAMPHAERALELKPDYGEAHDAIGRIHKLSGRHKKALASMQRAVHFSPYSSVLRTNLGDQLLLLGEGEAAIAQYERACELDGERAQAQFALATALGRLGRPEEAIDRYGLALAIEPELSDARLELARTLSEAERADEAIAQYERILSHDPTHAKALYGLERARATR